MTSVGQASNFTPANGHPFLVIFEESLQERLPCNVVTFGAIIGACDKGSQWRQSLRFLGRLQGELEPNVIAFSAVISACAKGDQWQMALQLLADVVETRVLDCGSGCVFEVISLGLSSRTKAVIQLHQHNIGWANNSRFSLLL